MGGMAKRVTVSVDADYWDKIIVPLLPADYQMFCEVSSIPVEPRSSEIISVLPDFEVYSEPSAAWVSLGPVWVLAALSDFRLRVSLDFANAVRLLCGNWFQERSRRTCRIGSNVASFYLKEYYMDPSAATLLLENAEGTGAR